MSQKTPAQFHVSSGVCKMSEVFPKTFRISHAHRVTVVGMKQRHGATVDRVTLREGGPSVPVPELPAWKAFVVQFSRDTATAPATFSGRIEHLSSGRRARFRSAHELLTIFGKLLAEISASSTMVP